MLISSELLTINLMNYCNNYCLNLNILKDFFNFLDEEIKKRYLIFFEIDADLDNLIYTAKYLIKTENMEIKLDDNVSWESLNNYLKNNRLDDEIEAIINSFVTKYSFENYEFKEMPQNTKRYGELVFTRKRKIETFKI